MAAKNGLKLALSQQAKFGKFVLTNLGFCVLFHVNDSTTLVTLLAIYSLPTSQVVHQVGAYPGFHSMKRLEVFLLPLDHRVTSSSK